MSTPCEERGWKVGDKFTVVNDDCSFAEGSTVELTDDDGSNVPGFRLISGHCINPDNEGFLHWSRVTPLAERAEDPDENEQEADAMIAQYERELHEGVGTQAHYMECAIQPIDFIVENGLDFLEGNVIKYVARYKRKNGLEDLQKAHQYLTWLIEREERGGAGA